MQTTTCVSAILVVISYVLLLVVPYQVEGAVQCDATRACFPMSTTSCTRGNNINLRFFMDAAEGYDDSIVEDISSPFSNRTVTYAFCPRVDELQAFNLTNAPMYATINRTSVENSTNFTYFVDSVADTYVSAYGFGGSLSVAIPSVNSTSRVMITTNGTAKCDNNINAVLLVDFLVFQISMTDGVLTYPGAVAPQENVTDGVSAQPQGVGFQPTCSGGACQLDASLPCIGDVGNQNCARCYTSAGDVLNKTVQIWVSYYGTDNNGRTLLSGSSNPLNFRKYAGASVFNTLSDSLDKVSSGASLDPSLDP